MNNIKQFIKRLFRHVNFSYTITIGGASHKIPVISTNRPVFVEKWMFSVLKFLINSDSVVFDVGVNLGQTLVTVKSIDKNIKVVGFEPNPACCFYLDALIEKNSYKDVTIFPVGIAEKSAVVKLDLYDEYITNSGGSIVNGYWDYLEIKPVKSVYVPVFRFDQLDIEDQPSLVKIDVEGAEYEVLCSLRNIIEKRRPLIICEVLSADNELNTGRIATQKRIESFLQALNYRNYVIRIDKDQELQYLERIDSFENNRANRDDCNYLFVPIENDLSVLEDIIKS